MQIFRFLPFLLMAVHFGPTPVLAMQEEALKVRIKKLNDELLRRDLLLAENHERIDCLVFMLWVLQSKLAASNSIVSSQKEMLAQQRSALKTQNGVIKKYEDEVIDFERALQKTVDLNFALKKEVKGLRSTVATMAETLGLGKLGF